MTNQQILETLLPAMEKRTGYELDNYNDVEGLAVQLGLQLEKDGYQITPTKQTVGPQVLRAYAHYYITGGDYNRDQLLNELNDIDLHRAIVAEAKRLYKTPEYRSFDKYNLYQD